MAVWGLCSNKTTNNNKAETYKLPGLLNPYSAFLASDVYQAIHRGKG